MTGDEQELLEQYLTHLNILGEDGPIPISKPGTKKSATPADPALLAPWKRPRSCASRMSSTPPGCSNTSRMPAPANQFRQSLVVQ